MSGRRRFGRSSWLAVVLACGLSRPITAAADYPVAPDVVVFCEPTLRHALSDAAALFRTRTGINVRIFASPTPALLQQIAHHARDDVLVGEGDANASDAGRQQLIEPGTLRMLGRNQLVVAERDGAADSEGSSAVAASLAAVAGRAPVAIVDPWASVAGRDSRQALQSLGLWQQVTSKSQGVVDTAGAVFLLTHDKVRLAIVYATDVVADSRLSVTERFPATSYPPIVYWVAETRHALSPNTARFIDFLGEPQIRRQLGADGVEMP
jgi:molybdate transport system substrate-binding protein